MTNSSVMIDLDDPKTARIGEIIGNKSARKILGVISEKEEVSESEISKELGIPANTVHYNIKKLVDSGLVEKAKKSLWSVKGRKIDYYRVSNKKIIISPKSMIKGILPAAVISLILALGIKIFVGAGSVVKSASNDVVMKVAESGGTSSLGEIEDVAVSEVVPRIVEGSGGVYNVISNTPNSWAWFLLGALTALLIFILWSWRKK